MKQLLIAALCLAACASLSGPARAGGMADDMAKHHTERPKDPLQLLARQLVYPTVDTKGIGDDMDSRIKVFRATHPGLLAIQKEAVTRAKAMNLSHKDEQSFLGWIQDEWNQKQRDEAALAKKHSERMKALENAGSATEAMITWIAASVATQEQPYCYKDSYGRGVGAPLSTCDSDQQRSGLLCYPKCKDGYDMVSFVCWGQCPSGYVDTGAFCHVDKALTRDGSWSCPHWYSCGIECPSGYTNAGLFCALTTPSNPPGFSGDGLDLIKPS